MYINIISVNEEAAKRIINYFNIDYTVESKGSF